MPLLRFPVLPLQRAPVNSTQRSFPFTIRIFRPACNIIRESERTMSSFSEQALLEKLDRLSSSQESIETLSMWIIHHRANAPAIATIWTQYFTQGTFGLALRHVISYVLANIERRLLLFYLVNDVLQNGRRKAASIFLDVFQDPLRHASTLIKLATPITTPP